MAEADSLWTKVGNECLDKALNLLKSEAIPTAVTVEMAKTLVETAVSIDLLNLRWEEQSRFCAAASLGQSFSRTKAKS